MTIATSRRRTLRRASLCLSTILASGLFAPASAQVAGRNNPPPVRLPLDENGVDVVRGTLNAALTDVTIGPSDHHGLAYRRVNGGFSELATIELVGSTYVVTLEGVSDSFTGSGGVYTATQGNGATLVKTGGTFTYTSRDGVVAYFWDNTGYTQFYEGELARLNRVDYPDGVQHSYTYRTQTLCPGGYENRRCQGSVYYVARLQSVVTNTGYQLKIGYANNTLTDLTLSEYSQWATVANVKAINNGVEYCDPAAVSCSLTGNWPTATYSGTSVTDPAGRPVKSYATATLDGSGKVQTATRDGVPYTYAYADAAGMRTTTVIDAAGNSRVYTASLTTFLISSVRDELLRTTSYLYDAQGRPTQITYPEGNKTSYAYDARGNVTETRLIAKTGSGLSDTVASASFPPSCTNVKTCNKPVTTTSPKGAVTDYVYDTTHGGIVTATAPPATTGATRPQQRVQYGTHYAYYKNASGAIVAGAGPIYLASRLSVCQTQASCDGAVDEARQSFAYGPQTTGVANNLLPVTVSVGSGDGTLTATTTLAYDGIGNMTYVDGPLAGTADTTRLLYDAGRLRVGAIGPDPDGPGARLHGATRIAYNADGIETKIETGTTTAQSDAAWAAFSPLQQIDTIVGADRRKTRDTVAAGGTAYAAQHYSYDALGRIDCTVTRMDPAQWSSQTDACVPQTTGPNGPDRVTKTIYNAASEVTQVQTAVGTAGASNEVTSTYTNSGRLATVKDGENNLTTYEYDGHDRLAKTRYPVTTLGGNASSTSDYEQLSYDANGNVTQARLRDGNLIGYAYDNLNRLTLKDLPNVTPHEVDIAYQHDLLGRLTQTSGP